MIERRARPEHAHLAVDAFPRDTGVVGDAAFRGDAQLFEDVARRLVGELVARAKPFREPREIFEELRLASRGGIADYYGITYEKIDQQKGVFWPCPSLDHPGTPRLFEGGVSMHKDGKCRFLPTPWRESGDPVDDQFPVYLTTGRVVSHYLSGTQTRRIGALVEQYPEPRLELHPRLAASLGVATDDLVTVTTRRTTLTLKASVVKTIRPDTVFIPYHWASDQSANRLTHRTLDPRSKIPEFKVSACRLEKTRRARSHEAER